MNKLINVITAAKQAFPQLRLTQIIESAVPVGIDKYYVTDEQLSDYILAWLKEK